MRTKLYYFLVCGGGLILFLLLSSVLLSLEPFDPIIAQDIKKNLSSSGVSHDVTAILLNFRALDTLLEVGVIVLALVGIYTIKPHFRYKPVTHENIITNTFVTVLSPLIALCSFYILYSGGYQSGGAFAAAAVLAGGIIILRLVRPKYLSNLKEVSLRFVYVSGLLFFLLAGIITLFFGSFLEYRDGMATFFILSIESVLTISLGVILATYFINGVQRFKQ